MSLITLDHESPFCPCSYPTYRSAFFAATLFVVCFGAISARAGNGDVPADTRLDTIVVTAKKHMEPVPDAEVKQQVETALQSDPFFESSG
jgi:hypothetical protein